MLNATLLARPVLNTQVNVPHARAAVEIFSTTNVLKSAQLEHTQSTELVNIVHIIARAVLDQILLVLLVPMERFFTLELAMINVPT